MQPIEWDRRILPMVLKGISEIRLLRWEHPPWADGHGPQVRRSGGQV